ncbi:MAG: HD domain-containing protein [Nanoarchaeota archaeon]|nr:HD domain-containing protein [Nanoarchaeota archaeon]
MDRELRDRLIRLASQKIIDSDPSHDMEHAMRVLANVERIAKEEKADMDIIVPAALFHDIVNHPKNSPKANIAPDESADAARKLLETVKGYPKGKIEDVCTAITQCSFAKNIVPELPEAKILQDADGLESTGAISIMRTFSSIGQMKKAFYHQKDPFCRAREPSPLSFGIDLFYARLLKVGKRMHTKAAKRIAKKRTRFLKDFLSELETELKGE